MKVFSKIIQIFTSFIAILAIVMFILPLAIGIRPFIVLSGSMEPAIKTGSIVYINTNVYSYEIEKNDIIAFKLNNQTVTHRVVEVNKNDETFITKGDANKEKDALPDVGRVVAFFKSKFGLVSLVALILLNLVLIIIDNDNDKDKVKENEKKK